MNLQLTGRKAVVTGASRGIGRAIAQALAAEGCHVGICARDAKGLEQTTDSLRATGVNVFGRAIDVADGAALRGWVGDAASALGGLDVVVANVSGLAIEETDETWQRSFDVDLMHTVRTVDAALGFLEQSDVASIVVISSASGREVDPTPAPYSTMKAALVRYARGLAQTLAPKRIRVNTVSPGPIYFEGGIWHTIEQHNPALFQQALASSPMGRMGTPEEVARGVVFLASPAASFIAGTNLLIDGGITRGVQL